MWLGGIGDRCANMCWGVRRSRGGKGGQKGKERNLFQERKERSKSGFAEEKRGRDLSFPSKKLHFYVEGIVTTHCQQRVFTGQNGVVKRYFR